MALPHTHEIKGFIPGNQVGRPDFIRGSMGSDINPHNAFASSATCVDKTVRDEIGGNSKTAHFTLGG